MMRRRKFFAGLLAVVMAICCVVLPENAVVGSFDLGVIYVEAAEYGTEYLTGFDLDVYNALKPVLYDIAAGTVSSTFVTVSVSYSFSDLGVRTSNEAVNAITSALDLSAVFSYMLYDCPYELYWFDKTQGVATSVSSSERRNSITYNLHLGFPVSTDYAGSREYTVDTEKVATANEAIENAQAIIDKYAAYSDIDKLTAYKDEICALVSYEYDYEDTDYGDIWQMIWVFDDDDSTNVVCEGYSKAFQYLCDISEFDSDVECYTVTGTLSSGTSSGNHMWNIVRIDGCSYLVDVTNSESDTLGANGELFLAGADDAISYSSTACQFYASKRTLTYTYDSLTISLYSSSVLTLGDTLVGDVNEDGSVDYLDAMEVLRYDAELTTLTDDQLLAGDVNYDGAVDSLDAILILRYDADLIDSF